MLDTIVIVLLSITLAALLAAGLVFFIAYFLISLPAAVSDWTTHNVHRTHHQVRPAH